jgi:hypothetical protein
MSEKLNLLPLILEAFGHNTRIYKDIDRLYQIRKYDFYRLARQSEFYNHLIIKEGDIYREEYGRKILGILLYTAETDDPEMKNALFKIIRKGWSRAYLYVLNNDVVSLDNYLETGFNNYKTDDDLNTDLLMVYWLALMTNKELAQDKAREAVEDYFRLRLDHTSGRSQLNYSYKNLDEQLLKQVRTLKSRVYEKYGRINSYDGVFHNKNDDVHKLAEAIALIFDTENISASSLFNNVKLKERDVEEVLGTYFLTYRNKHSGEAVKHLIWGLIVKGIAKAYKQVKEHYFKNNKETVYLEMKNQQDEIERLLTENEILKKRANELEKIAQTTRVEVEKTFISKIRELESRVARLEEDLQEERKKSRELAALREFLFSLDKHAVPQEVEDNQFDPAQICGAIVGGHPNWQNRMKKLLPQWVFINSDNFDVRVLDGVEAVFFFTQYLGHSLYYKAVSVFATIKLIHF